MERGTRLALLRGWAGRLAATALGAAAWLACSQVAAAAVLLSQDDALALAFPGARVERTTVFLDDAQRRRIESLAGSELDTQVITRYRGTRDGSLLGTAYFDAHIVRSLPETLMVVVGPAGEVVRVDVLSFEEPPDYLPRRAWFAQFAGRVLDEDLSLRRGIRGVTGATLSSRAVTAAVRRVLAQHRVLEEAAAAIQGDGVRP